MALIVDHKSQKTSTEVAKRTYSRMQELGVYPIRFLKLRFLTHAEAFVP